MIGISGLAELLANIGRVEGRVVVGEERGLHEAADILRDAWVGNIEADGLVLTGRYRDSITARVEGTEATVSTDVPYAGILEHGDSRQAAHPVAQRALDEHEHEATDAVGKHVREVIR